MGTQPRTISKADALAEAYKRGLLPPDKKAAYEEAQRRGLVGAPQAPARGGGFDMAPSSPAARRDMLTPAPAPKPMAAAPGAQYSFTPTPEMAASAPLRASIAENDQQQRAAGRIPLVTDRGGGYVADPGTQMADMATAQRMERERQERREAAAVNMGDLPLSTDAGGNIRPGSAVDEDIAKGIITSPVRLANAAVGAGESMVNLPGDVANAYLAGIYERGGGDKPQVPRLDAPRIPLPAELESMTGQLTEGLAQFLIARRAVGKVAPGGNLAANLGKDAIAVGVGFDGSTGRVADMINPSAIPEGPLRDYANWLRTQPEDSPLVGRLKNLIEDFTLSGPMLAPQPIVRGAQAINNVVNPAAVPTNAGGAAVQAARQAPPPPRPVAQPSVAPVAGPTIPQGPGRAAQAGPPGAGQQAPGGPATLQGVQTTPPVSKQQALIDRDTIKITRRIMRSAGIKDADVMGYLPGAVQRFESLNDPRIPLAFFLKSDLPKYFPEEVANRVGTNLDVWGRARNAETGVNDTSRATINKTVSELRKTQQDFLTQSAERNLFKGSLIGQEDQIVASLRETGRKGYEPVLDNARQIVDGRRAPTPDEAAAVEEIRGILSDPMMLGYVDDATRIRAKKEGVDLDQMLKDDPIGSAHWLQSEFRRLSDAAEDAVTGKPTRMSQAYDDLRDMVLDPLKRAAPGYEGAMNRYGHLYGAKDAVRFGKGIFTAGRSAYDTAQKVRQFRKLGRRQQTVAWKSIRDEFLNEFRGTPEDAAAKVTRMQSEGALDILEQLGPRGKRFADDIRSIAQVENPNLRAIDQGSGSPTYANQQGGSNAVDMVQSPVNQAIGAFGQKGSLPTTLAGDAVLAFSGLPPVLTLGKGVTWTIDKFGNPSKKVLARATEGLYGLPKTKAALPPPPSKKVGSRSTDAAKLEAEEAEDMAELLRALDQTEKNPKTRGGRKGQALLNKIDATAKAAPAPPAKKTAKPPQSNSPAFVGGTALGAATGAALPADSDEERMRNALVGAGITGLGAAGLSKSLGRGKGGVKPSPAPAKAPKPTPEPFTPSGPIKVYHSSPHDFDGFSMSKIGTGEGNQTYGHGIYFAENPGVTSSYDKSLGGKTYAAEIDVKPGELIDFDAPLEKQPRVAAAIQELAPTPEVAARLREMPYWQDQLEVVRKTNGWTQDQLAEALRGKGFKGIAYLDLGSRQAGKGTRNFVIFDEGAVKMTANPYKAPPAKPDMMGIGGSSRVGQSGGMASGKVDIPLPQWMGKDLDEMFVGGGMRTLERNPTARTLERIARDEARIPIGGVAQKAPPYVDLRWVKDTDGNIYVGGANSNIHELMVDGLRQIGVKMPEGQGDAWRYVDMDHPNIDKGGMYRRHQDGRWESLTGDMEWKPFDPSQEGSSKLLAGMGGIGPDAALGLGAAGAAALSGPRDINGDGIIDDDERRQHQASIGGSFLATSLGVGAGRRMLGNKLKGGPKPQPAPTTAFKPLPPPTRKSAPLKGVAGRAAVGGALGAMLVGDAEGQDDLTGKISETEKAIADLSKSMADFDKLDARGKQQFLKDAGFYAGKIDGNIAGMTTEGIAKWKAQQAAALEKAEGELTDLVRRDAYQRNRPNGFAEALREYGPTTAGLLALFGLKFLRGSAAKSSVAQAGAASKQLNRLITKGPVTGMINKADQSRPANLNTLWQEGGATKDQLPFRQDSKGRWQPNPNAKAAEELFSDNGSWQFVTKYVKGKDIAIILGGGADAAVAQPFIDKANRDLAEAEAEWKTNPSDETFKRVEDAKNAVAAYTLIQRIGYGVAGGRILGTIGGGYAKPKPNIPMAATEQAALKEFIAATKPPPKPRAPRKLPPPPKLLSPPDNSGNR